MKQSASLTRISSRASSTAEQGPDIDTCRRVMQTQS